MGIKSYETLCESYVYPILNYASAVWGYGYYNKPLLLQNRMSRFFLGVHRFAPLAATRLEMDWLECRDMRWLEMLRFHNRISTMDNSKLPKLVYNWDISLGLESWGHRVQQVAASLGLPATLLPGEQYDLTTVKNKLLHKSRISWGLEAERKPKLRTFIKIHDYNQHKILISSNLTRYQRSLFLS